VPVYFPVFAVVGWLHGTVVEWVTIYVGKPSAVSPPTRPTQPFILSGYINEKLAAIRCPQPQSGEAPSGDLT